MDNLKRKLSKIKISKKSTNVTIAFSGELDLKNRILAIHESIKALKKKNNNTNITGSIDYSNFDPTFCDEKSLDVNKAIKIDCHRHPN
jgi:hypothetical protein